MRIYTYDLGDVLKNSDYITFEDKAFNFHEFFRVFTGNMNEDYVTMPATAKVGDFVHERDVWSFLNMMTTESATNCYPYSNEEYRNLFKHSLWMVPGVKEAQALSKLMMKHPVFGNGMFEIVNVAGSGDEDEKEKDPLKLVREAIKNSGEDNYTITLSCGKLTTGVTVKEWTAVFMLAGSYSTSASSYLQTIFRVQSPCNKYGKIKETAYVFDFAPDRTLKMVASAVSVSSRAGKTKKDDIPQMGKFLNYCPVISVSGSEMKEYSATRLLQQLKKAYADKVVRNGFDDTNLYNDELFKLQEVDITRFKDLERIIGQTKALPKTNEIVINAQGLTNEQYEEIERLQKKKKKELTPEEKARLEEIKNLRDLRNNAISILRGISIRMPLLIFGADVPYDEEITLDKFVDAVDESSWEEFMPKGVTKEKFREFQKYYDEEIFIAAGRRIRNITREADTLDPIERVKKIAGLFSYFKNPDKETVLTPWRTVNMHMSDCLGGWCFWDEKFQAELDSPRYVDKSVITDKTFNKKDCKLLEINSKTGLYPLYLAFSCYNSQLKLIPNEPISLIQKKELWYRVLQNNIFVICKTPMARAITKRTLLGFSNYKVNAHCFDDLVNTMQNKTDQFKKRIVRGNFWGKGAEVKMKFDAIVGNPPYQIMDGGTKTSATPIYHYFVLTSKSLEPQFISMITPSRWFIGGKGLDEYRKDMLNDKRLSKIYDYPSTNDVFPSVDIAGGVSYFLWEKEHNGDCEIYNYANNETDKSIRNLNDFDVLPRFNKALPIIRKILALHTGQYLSEIASPSKPFGIRGGYKPKESGIPCQFKQKIGLSFADPNDVVDKYNLLDKWKFLAPYHAIAGQTDFTKPIGFYYEGNTKIIPPGTCCTETYIVLFSSNTKEEVESFKSYIFTKIARFLLLQCVISQDIANDKFKFVPHLGSYEGVYTDEILRKKWNITEEEWKYIDSKIINIKGK